MQKLVQARPQMIRVLDSFRNDLEDLGGGLGVTDPVSGNHQYSRMQNSRSPLVNSIRPRTLRCGTTNWCRSAAFSTSSRLFDLNGAVKTDQIKHQRDHAALRLGDSLP
jgi:hypothetical protein